MPPSPPMGGSGRGPMGTGGLGPMGAGSSDAGVAGSVGSGRFPLRIADIVDGTSNTLGVIEAGPPVPWTKPADINYDATKPLPFAGPFANVRNAACFDGSVHSLKPGLNQNTMRSLIVPNDGQVVPALKTLRTTFPADTEEAKKTLAKLLEQNLELIAVLEKQIAEHAALLALTNKLTKDLDRAEEEQERLNSMIESLKAKNKKLRDELGLRGGSPIPK
jgi:hypothetical protein